MGRPSVVLDLRGLRAASMIAEGVVASGATAHSARDVHVAGRLLCPAADDSELRRACENSDLIFLPNVDLRPAPPRAYDLVRDLDCWAKTVVLDFGDSSEVSLTMLDRCVAYFKRSWPHGAERRPRDTRRPASFQSTSLRWRRSSISRL
jgi:hypothetical protein